MLKCEICQSDYEPKNSLQKFCTDDCRKKSLSIRNSERRSKKRKEEFEKMGSTKKCLVCDSEFEVTQQHRGKKYCSESCSNKAERLFGGKIETDLEYKNKIRFSGNRFKALERDSYECQMCNNSNQLVVHHIDCSGQSEIPNNELDNLLTLCRSCHINLHRILDKMNQ